MSEEAWRRRWRALPVTLQIGGWIDTGRFRRFEDDSVRHAAGAYLVASSRLWQAAGAGGSRLSDGLRDLPGRP